MEVLPRCLPELFSFNSSPASFWICFGESKRRMSPTSGRNPATVMSPTPLMESSSIRYLQRFRLQYRGDLFQLYLFRSVILQKHLHFHAGTSCTAVESDAVLCGFYQGLRPLYPNRTQLLLPPEMIDAVCSQLYHILRQRCCFQHCQAAF